MNIFIGNATDVEKEAIRKEVGCTTVEINKLFNVLRTQMRLNIYMRSAFNMELNVTDTARPVMMKKLATYFRVDAVKRAVKVRTELNSRRSDEELYLVHNGIPHEIVLAFHKMMDDSALEKNNARSVVKKNAREAAKLLNKNEKIMAKYNEKWIAIEEFRVMEKRVIRKTGAARVKYAYAKRDLDTDDHSDDYDDDNYLESHIRKAMEKREHGYYNGVSASDIVTKYIPRFNATQIEALMSGKIRRGMQRKSIVIFLLSESRRREFGGL